MLIKLIWLKMFRNLRSLFGWKRSFRFGRVSFGRPLSISRFLLLAFLGLYLIHILIARYSGRKGQRSWANVRLDNSSRDFYANNDTVQITAKNRKLIGYPRKICDCETTIPIVTNYPENRSELTSSCSNEATDYGTGQKVRSFSLYQDGESGYSRMSGLFALIEARHNETVEMYPGWISRIYSNVPNGNPLVCQLICKHDTLFWCDITQIPQLGNLSKMDGRTWRFLPLGDPTVEIFLSRDLDTKYGERYRVAVAEWEESSFTFHTMRDHPLHNVPFLGGMWGGKNSLLEPGIAKQVQETLIDASLLKTGYGYDQFVIFKTVYMPFFRVTLAHDSYSCGQFGELKVLPFSIQRRTTQHMSAPCPLKCRHAKHWVYC